MKEDHKLQNSRMSMK